MNTNEILSLGLKPSRLFIYDELMTNILCFEAYIIEQHFPIELPVMIEIVC